MKSENMEISFIKILQLSFSLYICSPKIITLKKALKGGALKLC